MPQIILDSPKNEIQSFYSLHWIRMDIYLKAFLLITLLSMIYPTRAPTHPDCGPAGRCYTVNKHFGSFRQTRCVPCKKKTK
ncbi:uncharacterized protein LOC108051250 [Drosophila rhopaloa]|uniref:Uncharacterized protein LOC108051250 n=1 Tax=Drosophila rhopaloa TaxID=1041015 RepID=A0A6P4FMR0_DRORH|nr:uncharacterized protein LOC108051250 [Drosophila rhopaloa]